MKCEIGSYFKIYLLIIDFFITCNSSNERSDYQLAGKNINKCEFKVRNYLSAQEDGRVIL